MGGGKAWFFSFFMLVVVFSDVQAEPEKGSVIDSASAALDPDEVSAEYDEFSKETNYIGTPYLSGSVVDGLVYKTAISLVATRRVAGTAYAVSVTSIYDGKGFRNYSSAVDISGAKLSIYPISHDVECPGNGWDCTYTETFGIDVVRQDLESHRESGFRIRLNSLGGGQEFELPGGYVKIFLAKVPK